MVSEDQDFARLTDPYRSELLAYCYRMLGSVHDAEDQVQETLLRAWRSYGDFAGRSALRTWLYRIATNACLRALERRGRRPLPSGLGAPSDDPRVPLVAAPEVPWLQPLPDRLLGGDSGDCGDPGAIVAARAGLRLALIAALQYLPPRQRAVLILRDVLGWHAAEVAELLASSTAAVNSSLQRARAQLSAVAPREDEVSEPADPRQRELLDRYAAAFARADVEGLLRVLTEDVVAEMPPNPVWFTGRGALARFLASQVFTGTEGILLVPLRVNTQPGFAAYVRGRAYSIQALTLTPAGVARVVSFQDPSLFDVFGLSPVVL